MAERTWLQILNLLCDGERSVGELAELCDCTVANASRHLSLLVFKRDVPAAGRGSARLTAPRALRDEVVV